MSDEKIEFQITVSMTNKGNVHIDGVPGSAVMAYGLLEMAKEMIASGRIMQRIDDQKKLVTPPAGWVPPTRPRG